MIEARLVQINCRIYSTFQFIIRFEKEHQVWQINWICISLCG